MRFVWQDYYRELPYGWEVLAENLMDPSHLPFAHHGVLNRRYTLKQLGHLYVACSPR